MHEDEWRSGGAIGLIAELSGMALQEWRSIAPIIPRFPAWLPVLRDLLQRSELSSTHLYCLGDSVLQIYDGTIGFSQFAIYERVTGQKLGGRNEVVDARANLGAEELRHICVMLEALVFKSVHIQLENMSPSYKERNHDTYERRLQKLVDARLLDENLQHIGRELYGTRCAFAHSIQSIGDLKYLGLPLRDRWGSKGTSQDRELKRYFLSDAFQFSEALLGIFKPVQAQQFDGEMFRKALLDVAARPNEVKD